MSQHRYLLLLGSAREDGERRVEQAIARLNRLGSISAQSDVVSGPSVNPGDPHRYANRAVMLDAMLDRETLAPQLKAIETELGRQDGGDGCAIDIDLAREYSANGEMRWENPDKLAHSVFVALAAQVAPTQM